MKINDFNTKPIDPLHEHSDEHPALPSDHHPGEHPNNPPDYNRKITLFVNARPVEWNKPCITFEEAVSLAFGGYDPNPLIAYTMSYFDGPKGFVEGELTKGHSIPVKDGEKINVDRTNKS
ncbi:MAG: multiubiquitin domain-containing protein [Agathobacter sp.]